VRGKKDVKFREIPSNASGDTSENVLFVSMCPYFDPNITWNFEGMYYMQRPRDEYQAEAP
jgi:hypothetical protein